MIKKSAHLLIFFLFVFGSASSQNFDLIVTTKGDSIACFIEKEETNSISFKMMKDYEWEVVTLNNSEIEDYKKDAFKGLSIVFKPGTSYIEKTTQIKKISSVYDLKRNSVYAELGGNGGNLSLNYDRLFPLGEKTGLITRGGVGITGMIALAEVNFIYGGPRHFIETGMGGTTGLDFSYATLRLGYRFHAFSGFVLRAAPMFVYHISGNEDLYGFSVGVSTGYSF